MLTLETRPEPSRTMAIVSPLLALAITVVIGVLLFMLLGKDPIRGLQVFFIEPVKSGYALSELAVKATPCVNCLVTFSAERRGRPWRPAPVHR
jgi:simple sugar transport system permease protein